MSNFRTVPVRLYSIDDILQLIQQQANNNDINPATAVAIRQKVRNRRKGMPWLDAVGILINKQSRNRLKSARLDGHEQRVEIFDLESFVDKGKLLIISYGDDDPAYYALVLSYFLRICHSYRKKRKPIEIVQLVDEAHRIFDNDSRHSKALAQSFNKAMREGRTLDHSIIMSLQNASQIPHLVMNNLNTKVVMRQNSKFEADAATQTMGRDFAEQATRLGQGEALVSIFESKAVVIAQMAPSPFELIRSDNTGHRAIQQPIQGDIFDS